MKLILLSIFFLFSGMFCYGQADTSAYQLQRTKVNRLLDERSMKFGQYDQSLTMHTGIFGLKTKKDMQRSIDILTEIVQTDNHIFRELKILLDYKDLEKTQAATKASDVEGRINAYMQTIAKLQQQNDRLNAQINTLEKQKDIRSVISMVLGLALVALLYWISRKKPAFFTGKTR
ncbi:hypothetical protein FW774_14610 [Pedobacter sp. BS3]|uniref:hypothetical protein n=1 Tax=Pedobacter sp. BS3 TaxID=2567937 RepID=UPI0011ED8ECC|nr:hypothetical protein [Pedobacter sp. BS3]TZF82723.1 hypothetical protein FW774_14610 [Pedobacter sp. BS3]